MRYRNTDTHTELRHTCKNHTLENDFFHVSDISKLRKKQNWIFSTVFNNPGHSAGRRRNINNKQ